MALALSPQNDNGGGFERALSDAGCATSCSSHSPHPILLCRTSSMPSRSHPIPPFLSGHVVRIMMESALPAAIARRLPVETPEIGFLKPSP